MDPIKTVFSKTMINYTKNKNFSLAKTRSIIEQDLISDYREYAEYNDMAFSDIAFYGANKISEYKFSDLAFYGVNTISEYKFIKEDTRSKFSSFNNTNAITYTTNSRISDSSSKRFYIYERMK